MEHYCGHIYIVESEIDSDITLDSHKYTMFKVISAKGETLDEYDFIQLGDNLRLDVEDNKVRIYPAIFCTFVYDTEQHKAYGVKSELKVHHETTTGVIN